MNFLQILVLAAVQGLCELLPVSSSAHVILAERLMGLDPTTPDMTLLLVMLHTGTMFAVILFFWRDWRATYFSSGAALRRNVLAVLLATAATGVVGLALLRLIPWVLGIDRASFEIEHLFGNPLLIAGALAVGGSLILVAGLRTAHATGRPEIETRSAIAIGAVQGLCLPFRGFSRSGATISTALLAGIARRKAEEFSFALAVVLTPAVVVKEALRFAHARPAGGVLQWAGPSLLGMGLSFVAGWIALRWLSHWLERGRWHWFGIYGLLASAAILVWQLGMARPAG